MGAFGGILGALRALTVVQLLGLGGMGWMKVGSGGSSGMDLGIGFEGILGWIGVGLRHFGAGWGHSGAD